MNDISAIIGPDAVEAGLQVPNKKALFHQLSSAGERVSRLPARDILACLSEREKIGSTGFGGGVAIPHGRIAGIEHSVGFFARLSNPIDYQAVDGLPVDLVFLLLSPPDAGAEHLKALAGVSRALRDRTALAKLRGAGSKDALYALLTGVETLNAA